MPSVSSVEAARAGPAAAACASTSVATTVPALFRIVQVTVAGRRSGEAERRRLARAVAVLRVEEGLGRRHEPRGSADADRLAIAAPVVAGQVARREPDVVDAVGDDAPGVVRPSQAIGRRAAVTVSGDLADRRVGAVDDAHRRACPASVSSRSTRPCRAMPSPLGEKPAARVGGGRDAG